MTPSSVVIESLYTFGDIVIELPDIQGTPNPPIARRCLYLGWWTERKRPPIWQTGLWRFEPLRRGDFLHPSLPSEEVETHFPHDVLSALLAPGGLAWSHFGRA